MDHKAYEMVKNQCKSHKAQLVAVSKTRSDDEIIDMYASGQRIFGENKVQELVDKAERLTEDIEWHMIGTLQSNKVKYIAPFISMVHSVDRYKIAKYLNKEAKKNDREIPVLFQLHIAEEDTKHGYDLETLQDELRTKISNLTHIKPCGLMGMATFTDDKEKVRREFRYLKSCFDKIKVEFFANDPDFKEISMGMSGDYEIALEEGSTFVRIGTLLFGPRDSE